MSNVKLTIFFVLLLVFIAPAIITLGIRYVPDKEMPLTGESAKVDKDKSLEFEIESKNENLVGVAVAVKNPQRSKENLRFRICDEKDNILRESVVNGLSIPDGALVKFTFLPIMLEGMDWHGTFSSPAEEAEAMEVYLEKEESTPAFISLYKPASRLSLISSIYREWLEKFFADIPFTLVYLLAVIGVIFQMSTSLLAKTFSRFKR